MDNTRIDMEILPRLGLPSNANQQSNVNKWREAYDPYMPTTPTLNPVWNTGVPAPIPAPPPPPTVADTVANKVNTAITIAANQGTEIGNADRKAGMLKTLMGGDMQAFMQNLLAQQNTPPTQQNTAPPEDNFMGNLFRMFAQPEFQQPGFDNQGFGPTVLGATNALRAMEDLLRL